MPANGERTGQCRYPRVSAYANECWPWYTLRHLEDPGDESRPEACRPVEI
jgi:hypothetical protein